MRKYLVAILLPEPIRSELGVLQQRYKSPSWNISLPPHITQLPPADPLSEGDEQAVEVLSEAARQMVSFRAVVSGVDMFPNAGRTVFAKVVPNAQLSALHNILIEVAGRFEHANFKDARRPFHPHVTLSNNLDAAAADRVIAALSAKKLEYAFECDSFSLFTKEPKQKEWQECQKLSFSLS